jgi:hydroxymethylpyrimidine pyrophosphatase-like HAD family hydrolase
MWRIYALPRRGTGIAPCPGVFFKALACDYDGTLASQDRIGPAARDALGRARRAGLRLILVTGRTFFELTRVCDCLEMFHAVVAENGAVLYYPDSAMIRDQGPAVPGRLLAELDRRGIYYQVGRVIVGTGRNDEGAVKEALAAAEVTRDLIYNRAALMLLPAGVSKGSGVQQALAFLGLSSHDALAVGDAENDLPLFDACGWSACPGDSLPAVRERVDWVFPGVHGDGIAAAITEQILPDRLAVQQSPRHRISIGWVAATSAPVTIPARGVNVLIHGDPHSGKSWLAGALVERLVAARYSVCVIDPEGDYRVLTRLPGVSWTEVEEARDVDRALDGLLRDPAASTVLDLSALPHAAKVAVIERTFRRIREIRRSVGRPHWTLVDEAHYSLHGGGVPADALDIEDRGVCLVTYRPSWLREQVTRAVDVFVLARTTGREELAFLGSTLPAMLSGAAGISDALARLPRGEFLLVQRDLNGHLGAVTFVAAPRQTVHVRHLTKYVDSCVPPGREFLFRGADGRVSASADSLHSFRRVVTTAPDGVLAHHAERGDFSRWVRDVFADVELARQLRKVEARWRRRELGDLRRTIDTLITVRYGGDE